VKAFPNLRGDFFGGITTSVVSLPLAIAFGIAAFAPLGPEYVDDGALAGLYGAIVSTALASLFGGTPSLITSITAPMSVFVTSVIAGLMKDAELATFGANRVEIVLLMTAMIIFWAGLFQIIMGLVGGGKLIKFIPYPVIAGFMNGIAILIFLSQIKAFLGMSKEASLTSIFSGNAGIQTDTMVVGVVTIATMLLAGRFIKIIPGSLIGLLCGVGAYFLIGNFFNPELLRLEGNTRIIGPIPTGLPSPREIGVFFSWVDQVPMRIWFSLMVPAITLGILASIDTLLTSVVADVVTRTKHDSNRELLGQGIGNIASAAFGALPVAGSTVPTLVSINSGGRTRLAGLFNSLAILLIILVLGPFVQYIPMAVLAGILLVTAVKMVEHESLNLFKKKSVFENVVIILVVTIITVSIDLMIAVAIGLVIAAFLFVKEQVGKTIVRRKYYGHAVHSKKVRNRNHMRILEEKGKNLVIYELNGSLFFGTCDKLMNEIESDLKRLCIILDLKRVSSIDLTGAQLIRQLVDRVQDRGNHLLISFLDIPDDKDKDRLRKFLEDTGVIKAVGADHIFYDTDHALEWAEDNLIARELAESRQPIESTALKNISLFRELDVDQLAVVESHLHPLSHKKGDFIFKEGDPGDKIYFILSGIVSVIANFTDNGRPHRFTTFAEGLFFGDMAILEERPRSASIQAETDTNLLFMHKDDFQKLIETQPQIASRMLMGMARELSYRLRLANAEVRALSD